MWINCLQVVIVLFFLILFSILIKLHVSIFRDNSGTCHSKGTQRWLFLLRIGNLLASLTTLSELVTLLILCLKETVWFDTTYIAWFDKLCGVGYFLSWIVLVASLRNLAGKPLMPTCLSRKTEDSDCLCKSKSSDFDSGSRDRQVVLSSSPPRICSVHSLSRLARGGERCLQWLDMVLYYGMLSFALGLVLFLSLLSSYDRKLTYHRKYALLSVDLYHILQTWYGKWAVLYCELLIPFALVCVMKDPKKNSKVSLATGCLFAFTIAAYDLCTIIYFVCQFNDYARLIHMALGGVSVLMVNYVMSVCVQHTFSAYEAILLTFLHLRYLISVFTM